MIKIVLAIIYAIFAFVEAYDLCETVWAKIPEFCEEYGYSGKEERFLSIFAYVGVTVVAAFYPVTYPICTIVNRLMKKGNES